MLKNLTGYVTEDWPISALYFDLVWKVKGRVFIAHQKGRVVGWAFVGKYGEDRLQVGVFVHELFRCYGIGNELILRAKKYAKKKGKRLVADFEPDTNGKKLYDKHKIAFASYKWAWEKLPVSAIWD